MNPRILALVLSLAATPALAQTTASGHWVVEASVEDKPFVLHCDFRQTGAVLSGTCHDFTADGKAHALKASSVQGDKVRFVYRSNYLLIGFDAVYEGVMRGETMRGSVEASGHRGTFTGRRTGR